MPARYCCRVGCVIEHSLPTGGWGALSPYRDLPGPWRCSASLSASADWLANRRTRPLPNREDLSHPMGEGMCQFPVTGRESRSGRRSPAVVEFLVPLTPFSYSFGPYPRFVRPSARPIILGSADAGAHQRRRLSFTWPFRSSNSRVKEIYFRIAWPAKSCAPSGF
ncbi:hypothetical protein LZ30DRAFT_734937 [Colletotrichum cereale]|nr:hypothetical protein LZ30DRAFT_734937 [Colletotrichum cereale]